MAQDSSGGARWQGRARGQSALVAGTTSIAATMRVAWARETSSLLSTSLQSRGIGVGRYTALALTTAHRPPG
jgi:hypothetical protein